MSKTTTLNIELPEETYGALTRAAVRAQKSEAELARDLLQSSLQRPTSLVGLFSDEPELMDIMVSDAMQSREATPLRSAENNGG